MKEIEEIRFTVWWGVTKVGILLYRPKEILKWTFLFESFYGEDFFGFEGLSTNNSLYIQAGEFDFWTRYVNNIRSKVKSFDGLPLSDIDLIMKFGYKSTLGYKIKFYQILESSKVWEEEFFQLEYN